MDISELKNGFIYLPREFREGEVLLFEKHFSLAEMPVKAELFSTALGLYDAEINGVQTDGQLFKPGFTDYNGRLLCQHSDVRPLLSVGENRLAIYLAQGWYCGRYFCENKVQNWGDHPALSYRLHLGFADGTEQIIGSQAGDEVYSSEYLYAGEYDGEVLDFTRSRELLGQALAEPGALPLLEETANRVLLHESLTPVSVKGNIVDFGQNFAGIVRVNLDLLDEGETITLRHGEILNADGTLYTENLRRAKAALTITRGSSGGVYTPRFTYMGFRYVEIDGVPYREGLLTACAVYTDMERTGSFTCGDARVNHLYENQLWGQKSNYVEIPTDCPQRDERLGYTGDGHVFALTGCYNFDTESFWKSFFTDLRIGQLRNPDHNVPPYLPQAGTHPVGFMSMQGWGSAVSIIPEIILNQYGDEGFYLAQYEAVCDYVEMEISKMNRQGLWNAVSLGDWLSLGHGIGWQAMNNHPVSNAFLVNDLRIAADMAGRLGRQEEAERYAAQYDKTRRAYIRAFIAPSGRISKDAQGAYVMALAYVLRPDDAVYEAVKARFIANVRAGGLQTGFFATRHLLPLLADFGEVRLAYDLLLSEKCPGWMYQIDRGATTIWERWDAIQADGSVNESTTGSGNMVSFNHYAFGSVGEFYYRYILGIRPAKPGFTEVELRPVPDERLGFAEGSYRSRHGLIVSGWRYTEKGLQLYGEVPVCARILLPNGEARELSLGKYEFWI